MRPPLETRPTFDLETIADFPELEHTAYLTGVSTDLTRAATREDLGVLVTPASSIDRQLESYRYYGADNGLYVESKAGRPFDADKWLRWLSGLPIRSALFAALPDVLEWYVDPETGRDYCIGNLEATIERSAAYVDVVKELGFPVALVAQDGLDDLDAVPFDVDALFIGGSDDYKLGADVRRLVAQARARGLWVHVGRVNSFKRLAYCNDVLAADSADGTYIGFGPSVNGPKVLDWLDRLGPKAPRFD